MGSPCVSLTSPKDTGQVGSGPTQLRADLDRSHLPGLYFHTRSPSRCGAWDFNICPLVGTRSKPDSETIPAAQQPVAAYRRSVQVPKCVGFSQMLEGTAEKIWLLDPDQAPVTLTPASPKRSKADVSVSPGCSGPERSCLLKTIKYGAW